MTTTLKAGDLIVEVKKSMSGYVEVIKYKVLSLLGQGAFAKCYQVENEVTKSINACKVIQKK